MRMKASDHYFERTLLKDFKDFLPKIRNIIPFKSEKIQDLQYFKINETTSKIHL